MSIFSREPAAYAVIGLGRFGSALANKLCAANQNVILIDKDPDKVREFRHLTDYCYVMKHFSKQALEDVGVKECKAAIVCIGESLDSNLLATMYCINLNGPEVYAKANNEDQGDILEKIGAIVIYPERDQGVDLANTLLGKEKQKHVLLSHGLEVTECRIPSGFIGRKVKEIDLRQKYKLNICAIVTDKGIIDEIDPNYVFKAGNELYLIGSTTNIRRFEEDYSF